MCPIDRRARCSCRVSASSRLRFVVWRNSCRTFEPRLKRGVRSVLSLATQRTPRKVDGTASPAANVEEGEKEQKAANNKQQRKDKKVNKRARSQSNISASKQRERMSSNN
ncbi:hypothetical protein CC80DRAFT_498654 [Byssothecium circinans]|uniref:Uncharacterized protein n=1 Tax=Byssothecium circinans TaxID=147558 RepID=A0A6A5UFE5_9PLEO|nr:hypothetical protein CC80DRAFT_498654 [Byssothecium circinans]